MTNNIKIDGYDSQGVKTRPPQAAQFGKGASSLPEIKDATEQRREHSRQLSECRPFSSIQYFKEHISQMNNDLQSLVRGLRSLSNCAANIATRVDGHQVTIDRGSSVRTKSIERPHRVDTIAAPQDMATIPVARLSNICRDLSHGIESAFASLSADLRKQLSLPA